MQYSVADRGDELFILTNADGAIDFKVVTAPLNSPERANWRDLIPYREGVYILDVELYAGHMVRLERANALPAIIIRDLATSRRARHRVRRGGLFAGYHGRLRIRDDESALFLFVDDDAVGSLRLRHGEPQPHLAQAPGDPVRP